jgi:hypothetical protein
MVARAIRAAAKAAKAARSVAMPDNEGMDWPLHPAVQSLGFLLGTWNGRGRGEYPTIEPFAYREIVSFTHVGKPFVAYTQRTVADDDGRPLHSEVGYLRSPRQGWVELVVAHPTGVVEVNEGPLTGSSMRLRSSLVGATSTAKEVSVIERDLDFEPGVLRYSLRMAAVGQPLTHHLEARLQLEV